MATFTLPARHTSAYTLSPRHGDDGITRHMPIGLLLALTYTKYPDTRWTKLSRDSSTWSTLVKH